MPGKMVVCAICGQEVSKRSTLSLQELGQGNGRACRTHDEVAVLVDERHEKVKGRLKEKIASLSETYATRTIRIAAYICLFHTFEGIPIQSLYDELTSRKLPPDTIKDIKYAVSHLGGPLVPKTMIRALVTILDIKRTEVESYLGG